MVHVALDFAEWYIQGLYGVAEAVWQAIAHGTTLLDLAFAMERAIPLANPNDCATIKGDVEDLHRLVQGEGLHDVFTDVIGALRGRSLQRRSLGL